MLETLCSVTVSMATYQEGIGKKNGIQGRHFSIDEMQPLLLNFDDLNQKVLIII